MTEINGEEKKVNFLLNKQSSQKENRSDVATGGKSDEAIKPMIKRRVIVRKKTASEKDASKKVSTSNETQKVRVVSSRSKEQVASDSASLVQDSPPIKEKEVEKNSLQEKNNVPSTEVVIEKTVSTEAISSKKKEKKS